MKIFAEIELPIDIHATFESIISGMRDEKQDELGRTSKVIKEVGELGPGSIIETTYVDDNINFPSEVLENLRPHSFVHRTSTNTYELTVAITLKQLGNTTVLKSCSTMVYKNAFRNFIISYYAAGMMRSRHFLATHKWGYLFPNRILKAKYSCTVLGLPYYFVGAPLILTFFFILAKIQEYLGLNRGA